MKRRSANPRFVQVNYVLTWVWAAAMALMMAIDILAIYLPWLPLWAGLAADLRAALSAAVQFTNGTRSAASARPQRSDFEI